MPRNTKRSITPAGQTLLPECFLADLPGAFQQGRCIYKGRNEVRLLERVNEPKIIVKKYGAPFIFNRILYSLNVRMPKSVRSYHNAQEILRRGFRTPQPLMQEIHYQNGLLQDSYFVSACASGTAVSSVPKTHALIRALAQYTAKLHVAGMMHGDYILNNIFVTPREGSYEFELIDINRFIFQKKPLDWFHVCVNLMQPFHDKQEIKLFVEEYARMRQITPTWLLRFVLLSRQLRNAYSALKHALRKLPGAHYISHQAKIQKNNKSSVK